MSATNTQSSTSSNPQSSPPCNIHTGDNNRDNNGYIGDGDRNIVAGGNVEIKYATPEDGNELYKLLYHGISDDASHYAEGAPPKCHPGTRKTSCNSIREWMLDPAGSPLLWLHGPAGVGKSTIAKTISTFPPNQIRVVGTFFFSTCSDKSAAKLFPTLAWQLAQEVPETEERIVAALKRDRSLTKRELEHQFDQLIVQPLNKCTLTETSALLMVIDGVDECIDENKQVEFLNVLKRAGKEGCLSLRFLICSRPERRIREILETTDDDYSTAKPQAMDSRKPDISKSSPDTRPANTNQYRTPIDSLRPRYQIWVKIAPYLSAVKVQLNSLRRWRPRRPTVFPSDAWMLCEPIQLGVDKEHSSPEIHDELDKVCRRKVISRIQIGCSEESKDDVKKYLTDKFNEIHPSDPITSEEIGELVDKSCGQFLYASIIVKLLGGPGFSPSEVLDMARSSSRPPSELDKLYRAILDKAEQVMRLEGDTHAETDLVTLKDVFVILVVLWENAQLANIPDSFPIIGSLLVLKKAELERILRKMHSVLDVNPSGGSIRVYHRSFIEFLQHKCLSEAHSIAYPVALQSVIVAIYKIVTRNKQNASETWFLSSLVAFSDDPLIQLNWLIFTLGSILSLFFCYGRSSSGSDLIYGII